MNEFVAWLKDERGIEVGSSITFHGCKHQYVVDCIKINKQKVCELLMVRYDQNGKEHRRQMTKSELVSKMVSVKYVGN